MTKRRYYKEVRITQYRALLAIARQGGFASAAERLGLSTPSVWQQIRALENEFGTTLVEVSGQQVKLTEQGDALLQLAEPVVNGFDSIPDEFTQRNQSLRRKLSVVSPSDVLINELSAPLVEYRQCYPNVDLILLDAPSNPARAMLEAGEVDLAIAGLLKMQHSAKLESDVIDEFPFTLICPKGHPILETARITPKVIARYPLVMSSPGTNTRTRVDEVLGSSTELSQLRISCVTSTKALQLKYVELGFGIAVIPTSRLFITQSRENRSTTLEFVELPRHFGMETIAVLRLKRRREPIHQAEFREVILKRQRPGD